MPKGLICNSAELARTVGVTYQTIQAWIADGMPFVEKPISDKPGSTGWKFDVGEVLKWRVAQAKAAGRREASQMTTLDEAKVRKMDAEAQLAELNLKIKLGAVVPVEAVVLAVSKHIGAARSRLLSLPVNLGPLCAAEDTASACQQILDTGVREALEELSGTGFDGLPGGNAVEGVEDLDPSTEAEDFGVGGSVSETLA